MAAVTFLARQSVGTLAPDYDRFISQLNANSVEFVVIGAHALAFHGVLTTGDLDILIRPTEANAEKFLLALTDFGFPTAPLTPAKMTTPGQIIEMGLPPVQIHVMSQVDGVSWDEVWAGRQTATLGSHSVAFIGRVEFLWRLQSRQVTHRQPIPFVECDEVLELSIVHFLQVDDDVHIL